MGTRGRHRCQLTSPQPCPTTQHAVKAAQTSCVTPACAFLHRVIRTGKRTYHRRTVSGVASVQAAFRIGARIEIKALTQKRQSGPPAFTPVARFFALWARYFNISLSADSTPCSNTTSASRFATTPRSSATTATPSTSWPSRAISRSAAARPAAALARDIAR